MFDKPADYATAKLSTLANPESLGHIKLDSTSFTGEAASLEPLKNEQGKTYYNLTTEGTFGFEFFAASTSSEMLTEFFGAETISDTFTGENGIPASATVLGLMHKPAILERPIMIVNDTADRSIIIPRAKIVANLEMDGKEVGIRVNVSAEGYRHGKPENGNVRRGRTCLHLIRAGVDSPSLLTFFIMDEKRPTKDCAQD